MNEKGIFYLFLYVRDLERSKRFYGETLGWTIGTNEKDVAGFSFGTGYLVIHADTRPEPERKYGGGMWAAVQVEDVEKARNTLRERGVKVGEMLTQPWGEKQFYFDDPDGYHWSFGQSAR